jgi:putative ABC transport system substrate-binding protein
MKAATASPRVLAGIALFAGLLGACSTAPAQSPTPQPVPRVGLMHVGTDHNPPSLGTLVSRLSELGWIDGSPDAAMRQLVGDGTTKVQGKMAQLEGEFDGPRIVLIWRNLEKSQTNQQAMAQAKEFVDQHVDVIVAFEDTSIHAAQDATAEPGNRIPVVFLHPSDPVRDGLVESLSHPGGNLTGVFGARDPVAKQLELYKEIMPGVQRLLTLVDPTDTTATPPLLTQASDAAQQLGITLVMRNASDEAGLQQAFRSVTPGDVDGAFLLSPSLRLNFSQAAIDLATAANLPIQAHRKEWVKYGALFSLGVDVGPVGTAGADFVDAILKGTPPADRAVVEVPRVEFALNLKRAKELHIDVAQEVLDLVDVVYP